MSAPMQRRASTLLSKCGSFPGNIRIENFSKELVGVSRLFSYRARQEKVDVVDEDEFRVLEIPGAKPKTEVRNVRRSFRKPTPPPRFREMPTDQDWTNVWPSAQTFKWSSVPFPVRQGYIEKSENDGLIPGKYANAELMKIPNFLHLTPAHIKKHCAALKEFCTEWPAQLTTDELCDQHFPIEISTSDYVKAGSLHDHRARKVTLKMKLSSLDLDYHARDKFLRIVGDRYNKKTDMITIVTDRCPLKKQNYDYAMYLLTALYYESWKVEPWEADKTEADMEKYVWEINQSKKSIVDLIQRLKESKESGVPSYLSSLPEEAAEEDVVQLSPVLEYKDSVSQLHNEGENSYTLTKYKDSVKHLLNLPA